MSLLQNLQRTLWKGSSVQNATTHNRQLSGHSESSIRSFSLVFLPVLPTSCAFPGILAGPWPSLTHGWLLGGFQKSWRRCLTILVVPLSIHMHSPLNRALELGAGRNSSDGWPVSGALESGLSGIWPKKWVPCSKLSPSPSLWVWITIFSVNVSLEEYGEVEDLDPSYTVTNILISLQ